MSTTTAVRVSPEEYLEFERSSPLRHEYRDGEIIEVTGASPEHISIVGNLVRFLKKAFDDSPAEVYSNDMRVKVSATGQYVYPDVVVVSGKPELEGGKLGTLLNPAVVFDVLSESTEDYDRGDKREDYQSIETVTDYLLVFQDERRIERYIRQDDDSWLNCEYAGADAIVEFPALDCELKLRDVYRKIPIDEAASD